MDMGRGEERVRCMERVTWNLHYHMGNRQPMGIRCMAQETQTGAPFQSRGVEWGGIGWDMGGRLKRRGYMYTYS